MVNVFTHIYIHTDKDTDTHTHIQTHTYQRSIKNLVTYLNLNFS